MQLTRLYQLLRKFPYLLTALRYPFFEGIPLLLQFEQILLEFCYLISTDLHNLFLLSLILLLEILNDVSIVIPESNHVLALLLYSLLEKIDLPHQIELFFLYFFQRASRSELSHLQSGVIASCVFDCFLLHPADLLHFGLEEAEQLPLLLLQHEVLLLKLLVLLELLAEQGREHFPAPPVLLSLEGLTPQHSNL